MPNIDQNEIHPYYQENDVIPYVQSKGIVMQGWYPFGGRGHTSEILGNEAISKIVENHNASSAQVILRWNLQKTDEEMSRINSLDRNEKHDWY